MSRTADYDSVEPLPQKALDQRVSYFLGLFVTGLLAVGVVAGVVGGIQYFNAEVVGVGKGATGAPGSDIVTALPPTLSPTALLTAVATALSNVSLPRGPPGFNATCTCPLVRNGTDSTVPGPAGPQGPQGIMGPVYYSNGTAPSTFSHITVVAGGTWTGGPVFDDVTITHNLTVYNAMSAKLLIAGSSGQFKVDATGAVQAAGFFAGNSTIFTTSTVYGGVLSLSGTAQNSLQTQGGIQAVNNIASTTGSVTTAAASMSSTGVFTGTTAQIAGDVNGKRGVFATDIIVGGGVFSVNSTGAVTARSLQTVGTISTPLASLDAAGTVKGVTVWTPLASINAAGMINGTAVFSSSTIATPLASMNAAGLINGTAVWTPLASLNAAGLVNGTAIWTPLASMNAAGLVNGTAVWTPLASMNSAGVVNGTNVVGLQSVSTPLLDMSATSGSMIKQVSAISFNATAAIIDMHGVGNILGVAILNATAVNAPNINVLNGAITNVHSISGDSSGTVSISGKLQANGLFTASAGALVSGTMTANSLAVNGGTLNGGPGSLSTPGDVSISGFLIVTNAITANGGVTVPGDADITYTCNWSGISGMSSSVRFARKAGIVFVNIRGSNSVTGSGTNPIICSSVSASTSFRVTSIMNSYVTIPFTCVVNGVATGCYLQISSITGAISAYNNAGWGGQCQIYPSSGSYILE